ncbi:MAG: class I SAM-dependent methyltransferase [Candidatus Thorarchaeota archaeon]|nr:class I SAM-dependent methyltransferase [Candidatus Thorarchaeota archaeon]
MSPEYSLEQTMGGPFWARATLSQKYPELLNDTEAIRIYNILEERHRAPPEDLALTKKLVDEFIGLLLVFRARSFDDAIRKYIEVHPRTTIVNIGCGLDTTFSRVDNGQILWYDLDLPDAIAIRKENIPETSRSKVIPKSVFDQTWFELVDFSKERGIFFLIGGLLNYFKEEEVVTLVRKMASRFPSGELIFDMPSSLGTRIWNRRLRKTGTKGVTFSFSLDNAAEQIARWDPTLQVIDEFPIFSRLPHNPKWKRKTRLLMRLNHRLRIIKIIQVKFPD